MKKIFTLYVSLMISLISFSQVKIVEWGGDMVTANAALPAPSNTAVYLPPDSALYRLTKVAFDENVPLAISSNYSNMEGPIHFAFLGYSRTSGGGFDDIMVLMII